MGKNKTIKPADVDKMVKLHAEGHSVREIARRVGCSYATVGRKLRASGADTSREQTANATIARMNKVNENCVNLAEDLLQDARSMRERVWSEYETYINGYDGAELVYMKEPPLKEQSDGVKAIQAYIQSASTLLERVPTGDENKSKDVITKLVEGLTAIVSASTDTGDERDRDHDYDIREDPTEEAPKN